MSSGPSGFNHNANAHHPSSLKTSFPEQPTGEGNVAYAEGDLRSALQPIPVNTARPQQDVGALVRELSTQMHVSGVEFFKYEKGSVFDPFGGSFNARRWFHKFSQLEYLGGPRKSGISFKNTSVHGFGSDTGESFECQLL